MQRPLRRRVQALVAAAAIPVSLVVVAAGPAQAQGDTTVVHPKLVSEDPADFTPQVKDGQVESVVQVGNLMVIGGTFTELIKGTQPPYARTGLAAFDATTGAVSTSFNPVLNGTVTSLEVAADGQSVYVGGTFSTVNGVTRKKVAQVRVSDGSLVTGFRVKGTTAQVNDLRRVGNTLWMAGQFAKVDGQTRRALATVNATTGALTSQSTVVVAGQHNGGSTNIREIAITPDGTRMVVMGNFTTLDGLARRQVGLIDISGANAVVSGWSTTFFTSTCASVFDTYLRDVAVSPDGTYAVFVTTGAYRNNTSCDTISRFDITGTTAVTPTWIDMTGGDTTTAVTIAGDVIYIGGHFRWVNNFAVGDRPGHGAITRTGLAALDPTNGLPFDWDPTRERGYGVYDFLATDTGLWVGSDTDNVGNEYHPRIAFFPLAGGAQLPDRSVGSLPGDVITIGPGAGTSNAATSTQVNASGQPGATSSLTTGDTWSNARGAMLVGDTVYAAWSDRQLYASPLNGSSLGTRSMVNLMAGPLSGGTTGTVVTCTSSGQQYCNGSFAVDVPTITGMFYDSGRMYYTMSGVSSLYYRYFEPGEGWVGGVRYSASGGVSTLNPSRVRGMFLSGGQLYFADATSGDLLRIAFSGGVVGSSLTTVDTTRDWQARGLALRAQPPANQPPTADIDASCTFLVCTFDGRGSSDVDGSIASYEWDFGDGGDDTGNQTSHTYAADGSYTVTLTVTDDDGDSDTATYQADVSSAPASAVAFRGALSASSTGSAVARVNVPAAVQAGDTLVLFVSVASAQSTTLPGWTLVDEETDELVTRVFSRTATAADAGTQVSVTLGASAKWAATLAAYDGVDTAAVTATSSPEPGTSAAHTAPSASVGVPGSWVVHYWADKTSGTTGWTVPGSLTQRQVVLGTGGGQVGGVTADSAGPVPTGTYPGATATSSTSSGKATSFSVVLPPS